MPVIFKLDTFACFANDWKCALVHPLLKKHGLQPINKNFRSVSNLELISKLKEKAGATQIESHMEDTEMLSTLFTKCLPTKS